MSETVSAFEELVDAAEARDYLLAARERFPRLSEEPAALAALARAEARILNARVCALREGVTE